MDRMSIQYRTIIIITGCVVRVDWSNTLFCFVEVEHHSQYDICFCVNEILASLSERNESFVSYMNIFVYKSYGQFFTFTDSNSYNVE